MGVHLENASQSGYRSDRPLPEPLARYFKFNARLSFVLLSLAVLGLCIILAAVLTQIYGRYILNDSPAWTEIFALVVILYVTCFAAAVGVRDGRHIGMDSLLTFLSPKARDAIDVLVYLSMIVFGAAMAWGGGVLAVEVWPYLNPGLPISQGWSYVPLSMGGLLIVYFAVEHIIARIIGVEVVPSWH
jgi:TRAP-type transport system small permease protein